MSNDSGHAEKAFALHTRISFLRIKIGWKLNFNNLEVSILNWKNCQMTVVMRKNPLQITSDLQRVFPYDHCHLTRFFTSSFQMYQKLLEFNFVYINWYTAVKKLFYSSKNVYFLGMRKKSRCIVTGFMYWQKWLLQQLGGILDSPLIDQLVQLSHWCRYFWRQNLIIDFKMLADKENAPN